MILELTIDENSTKKALQDQVSAAFDKFKADLAKAKLDAKLERVFRILISGEQSTVKASQLFIDAAKINPFYSGINLVLDTTLPVDKLAFKLEQSDLEPMTVVVR